MNNLIKLTKKHVLSFLNYKNQDISGFEEIIEECILEVEKNSQIKSLIDKQPIISKGDNAVILKNGLGFSGKAISKHLKESDLAVIIAVTIGYQADKIIMSLQKQSPSKALVMNAAASALAELAAETLHKGLIKEYGENAVTKRFSPGFKDFPIQTNKDIIEKYNLTKRYGIMINDSLLMSPSKTITAITGIKTLHS